MKKTISKLKVPLILSAIILLLVGVSMWEEAHVEEAEELKKTENLLVEFDKNQVTSLLYRSITNGEELKVELEKTADHGWQLTEPVKYAADKPTVEALVAEIHKLKYKRIIAEDRESWKNYGLENPNRIIRIGLENGKSFSVYFGEKAPVNYGLYLRSSDRDVVYTVSQSILSSTNKKLLDFRLKDIFQNKPDEWQSYILLNNRKKIFEVKKSSDDSRQIQLLSPSGKSLPTSISQANDFLQGIHSLKAEGFVDDPESKLKSSLSAQRARFELKITYAGDKPQESYFLNEFEDKWWLRKSTDNSVIYMVKADAKDVFDQSLNGMRNKELLDMSRGDVTEVSWNDVVYTASEQEWKSADGKAAKQVATLLQDLEFAQIEDFISSLSATQKKLISSPAAHRLRLSFKKDLNKKPVEMSVWKNTDSADGFYLIRASNHSDYLKLKQDALTLDETQEEAELPESLE